MENRDLSSNEAHHLEPLTKEQSEGFIAFKEWFLSDRRLGVLMGVGGSGKTFAVAQWVKALSINPLSVLALAPTHKAVQSIQKSLHEKGVECECLTIHKALGWINQAISWNKEDELQLLELTMEKRKQEDAFEYDYVKESLNPRIRILAKAKEAVRKEELVFSPGPSAPSQEDYKHLSLVVVDECSMISEEIYDALTVTFDKILFIGDDEQLFPVGEGMSKSFEAETVAEFLSVRRNSGPLREFNHLLRGKDVTTMHSLCLGVDPTDKAIADNEVATITKSKAKDLSRDFLKTLEWDGYSFRVLFYKNKTIENFLIHAKKFVREDWQPGDQISAYKPISRWCGSTEGTVMALTTDTPSKVLKVSKEAWVPVMSSEGEGSVRVFRATISAPNFSNNGYTLASLESHVKQDWIRPDWYSDKPGTVVVNLVSFEDFKGYREITEQWRKMREILYARNPKISKYATGARLLFRTLGIESWTQIPNTPSYSRFSVEDLRSLQRAKFLKFDEIKPLKDKKGNSYTNMPVDYYRLRTAVNKYYFWLKGLHDTVRLRIASTVHKSQGETIDRVLMHLPEIYESRLYGQDGVDNARRAIYTAASRASKQLYVIN